MEKTQKIAMKKFVIVIALGSNCPGVIIRGQYNSPKWELSGGNIQGAIVLGGNCPGGNCPRWELSGGQLSRGQLSRGQLSGG